MPKRLVVQGGETEEAVSNATQSTPLRFLQGLVYRPPKTSKKTFVKFILVLSPMPHKERQSNSQRNLCIWKWAWWVYLNYFFLAEIVKWHLNPTGLTRCHKEIQNFYFIVLETSGGGLQMFSCQTFLTAMLVFRPELLTSVGIILLCLPFCLTFIQLRHIKIFQCVTLQIKSKSAVCTGHS